MDAILQSIWPYLGIHFTIHILQNVNPGRIHALLYKKCESCRTVHFFVNTRFFLLIKGAYDGNYKREEKEKGEEEREKEEEEKREQKGEKIACTVDCK